MLSRRIFLAVFSPQSVAPTGGSLIPNALCAAYDLRTRRTTIYFQSGGDTFAAEFDHDSSRLFKPYSASALPPKPALPTVQLRLAGESLNAYDNRQPPKKLSTLMQVPKLATLRIGYPHPAHPDIKAIWSIDNRIYFTNNDYRNVYLLPVSMREASAKPALL